MKEAGPKNSRRYFRAGVSVARLRTRGVVYERMGYLSEIGLAPWCTLVGRVPLRSGVDEWLGRFAAGSRGLGGEQISESLQTRL